jgi:hypothetical protein
MVEGVSDEPCNHHLRPRLLEWCVNVSLALATANILLICMMGGYRFTIGPLQVSAYHLKNPLILFLSFAAVKIWFILKHREMPVFVKQTGLHSGDDLIPPTHERIEVRDAAFVLLIFVLSRGVVFSAMTVSPWFVAQSANPNIWQIEDSLLRPLFRWDAGWYLSIAQHGYSYSGNPTQHHNIAFLPLYPLLCRMCYEVTGLSIPQCAILLSNLAFLLGLLALYRLVAGELNAKVARHTVWLLAFFPASFFFSSMYTESFYLFFSVLAFTAFRRQRFLQGGIWSGLAAGTRVPGILLCVPLFCEGLSRRRTYAQYWHVIGAVFLTAGGLLAYMGYEWIAFGDPIANFRVQQQAPGWQREVAWPFESIEWGIMQTCIGKFSPFPFDAWLALLFIALACAMLFYLPKGYALYTCLGIGMPLFTAAGIWSMTRYLSVLFPTFMMLGMIGQRWRWIIWMLLAVFTVGMVYFSMYFAQWHWVG